MRWKEAQMQADQNENSQEALAHPWVLTSLFLLPSFPAHLTPSGPETCPIQQPLCLQRLGSSGETQGIPGRLS